MHNLTDNDVVKAAAIVSLAYVATQAVVAGVRIGQFSVAAVREFRKNEETPVETATVES